MNKGLSLIFLALFAVASVHSLPKIPSGDLSMQQLVAQMKGHIPEDKGNADEWLVKLKTMVESLDIHVDDLNEPLTQTGTIGPEFDSKHFIEMIRRVSRASWTKKCKQVSGNDDEYAKAVEITRQTKTCFENWSAARKAENPSESVVVAMKNICSARSEFNVCWDKYVEGISGCYYPSEMENLRKVYRILKNVFGVVCENSENDFAIFDPEKGDGMKCVQQNFNEIKTCANKAVFSGTERILEKWIENEHFKFEMEPEDCQAYDETKNCFVSSVESCPNPKVKNIVSSVFQIFRDETKC